MMLNDGTIVQALLKSCPDAQAIYLFGSYADHTTHPESDLDVAVLRPPLSEKLDLWNLFSELHGALGVEVDLIDLRRVSTVFQNEIIRTGRRIYCCDAPVCDEFEALVLSQYQKLNQERREILQEFYVSKRAYAV